jgi:hypothetical protein
MVNLGEFNDAVRRRLWRELREPCPVSILIDNTRCMQDESWSLACLVAQHGIGGSSPVWGVADVVRRSVLESK